ncbi:hypothetical protein BC828DRAFT_397341 [Blastocladiella britannica]|nr:hypothetical protein BC828DRAFT_397341 [Blastocladiella britannica]
MDAHTMVVVLKSAGRKCGFNAFHAISTNVHSLIAADELHQVHLGVTQSVCQLLEMAFTQKAKDLFNWCTGPGVTRCHAWSLRKDSPFKTEKVKAHELAGLLRVLAPALVTMMHCPYFDAGDVLEAKLCLKMVTSYVRFYTLITARFPTKAILDASDAALKSFMAAYSKLRGALGLTKPEGKLKLHKLTHYRQQVERFGPIAFQSTQRGEHEHSVSVKPAAQRTKYEPTTLARDLLHIQVVRTAFCGQLRECIARLQPTFVNRRGNEEQTFSDETLGNFEGVQDLLEKPDHRHVATTFQFTMAMFGKGRSVVSLADAGKVDRVLLDQLTQTGHQFTSVGMFKRVKLVVSSPSAAEPVPQFVAANYPKDCPLPMSSNTTRTDGLLYLDVTGDVDALKVGFLLACVRGILPDNSTVDYLYIRPLKRIADKSLGDMITLEHRGNQRRLIPVESLLTAAHVVKVFELPQPVEDDGQKPPAKRRKSAMAAGNTLFVLNHFAEQHTFHMLSDPAINTMVK